MAQKKNISLSGLKKNNIAEWLKYTYYTNPVNFKKAFESHGIKVSSDSDLDHLEKYFYSGHREVLSICHSIILYQKDLLENIIISG